MWSDTPPPCLIGNEIFSARGGGCRNSTSPLAESLRILCAQTLVVEFFMIVCAATLDPPSCLMYCELEIDTPKV